MSILSHIFGSRNERVLKRYRPICNTVNNIENEISQLSDDELKRKSSQFKEKLDAGASLDSLLPESFAVVREAAKRALGMRHFDVQIMGGIALHEGNITEMRTGEGKTLVATLPAYLNALTGNGVHIVTVNEYLAKRDSEWMGKIYSALGMSTGVIVSGLDDDERQEAYCKDIVYGTNSEFGFDYLRDNMKLSEESITQRGHHYAIVDEVDSILIDEARTPLIISGPSDESSDLYLRINKLIPYLSRDVDDSDEGDFHVDEKSKQIHLTENGHNNVEKLLTKEGLLKSDETLYDVRNIGLMHHVLASLRAHTLYQRDVDYIINDNEIVIIDEFTGRTMEGRRWSDGLHQAIEAKEGVTIQSENQTLASITYQNYFRIYKKLSGMTGTADTEAVEFQQIYGLEVIVIPTHKPMIRNDAPDLVYLTQKEKFIAAVEDIEKCINNHQPVLVGTASIETSEHVSNLLEKRKIKHNVLNAKQHAREAEIIAQAGQPGAVTIATNMAGRGTDIVLGGNIDFLINSRKLREQEIKDLKSSWQEKHETVLRAGGLHVIGTERHESRRVDNQLRGRSGRQGDPGSSRFYVSLDDNLMRIFASDKISSIMQKLGMREGEAIEHTLVSRAIENAQRKVESHNFSIRKDLLEYDDVANDQRKVIYEERHFILGAKDIHDHVLDMWDEVVTVIFYHYIPGGSLEEQWDVPGLENALIGELGTKLNIQDMLEKDHELFEEKLLKLILDTSKNNYEEKKKELGEEVVAILEKDIILHIIDLQWKEHLSNMDYLRQGIHLRGYAQKNPKQEYKREAFDMFNIMLSNYKYELIRILANLQVKESDDSAPLSNLGSGNTGSSTSGVIKDNAGSEVKGKYGRKIGRNEPCPCGSGKKYKRCHGKIS